jgi:hypothetical protein
MADRIATAARFNKPAVREPLTNDAVTSGCSFSKDASREVPAIFD